MKHILKATFIQNNYNNNNIFNYIVNSYLMKEVTFYENTKIF